MFLKLHRSESRFGVTRWHYPATLIRKPVNPQDPFHRPMEVSEDMKVTHFVSLVLLSFVFAPLSLFAQSAEIEPYAGYYWSGTNASGPGRFMNNQLLGVRGGGYITPNFELGGNYSWSNHFQPNSSNTGS